MGKPLVSIIIPNYCHADFLDQRLQSVLKQSYKNFEVIIMDDCSPDNGASRSVIERYKQNQHVKQIIYNDKNSGSTFKQWNKGFRLAQGELIWIAESDDYCEPTFLDKCVRAYLETDNVAFVHVASILVNSEGKEIDQKDSSERIPNCVVDGKLFISKYMCTENVIWNASAVVFRKDCALNADTRYQNYKAAGDHLFWIELAEQGNVVHLSDRLNYFRQHQVKVTPAKFKQGITHKEELKTLQYIKNKGFLSRDIEREAYIIYLYQILNYEYENHIVRLGLLFLWAKNNPVLFLRCIMRLKGRECKSKLKALCKLY